MWILYLFKDFISLKKKKNLLQQYNSGSFWKDNSNILKNETDVKYNISKTCITQDMSEQLLKVIMLKWITMLITELCYSTKTCHRYLKKTNTTIWLSKEIFQTRRVLSNSFNIINISSNGLSIFTQFIICNVITWRNYFKI